MTAFSGFARICEQNPTLEVTAQVAGLASFPRSRLNSDRLPVNTLSLMFPPIQRCSLAALQKSSWCEYMLSNVATSPLCGGAHVHSTLL